MKWTHKIPVTKNGKERPQEDIKAERNKVGKRIDEKLICPMNWLQDCLDKIQGASKDGFVDTKEFFVNNPGWANNRQMSKIRKIVEDYDGYTKRLMGYLIDDIEDDEILELLMLKTDETYEKLKGLKMSKITINRLVGSVIGIDMGINNDYKYKITSKYTRKMMNLLYNCNREYFLSCFKQS